MNELSDARVALVYDEALRAIAQQQSNLDGLRTRIGTLLSAASISTAFLGASALKDRTPGRWGWIAIGSFVLVVVASILILNPYQWTFRRSPRAILGDYVDHEEPVDLVPMQRALAEHLEDNFKDNEVKLNRLYRVFQGGCGCLALEVVAWLIELQRR